MAQAKALKLEVALMNGQTVSLPAYLVDEDILLVRFFADVILPVSFSEWRESGRICCVEELDMPFAVCFPSGFLERFQEDVRKKGTRTFEWLAECGIASGAVPCVADQRKTITATSS